jgi:hypothetical protein
LKGVIPPYDYIPYHERIENERRAKEKGELRRTADTEKRKADEEAYNKKVAQFDALPQVDQERWLEQARTELSAPLKGSKKAARSMAIELCNKRLRDRDGKTNTADRIKSIS